VADAVTAVTRQKRADSSSVVGPNQGWFLHGARGLWIWGVLLVGVRPARKQSVGPRNALDLSGKVRARSFLSYRPPFERTDHSRWDSPLPTHQKISARC
jgi:hypothetical protein